MEFDFSILQNPEIYHVDRLVPHSDHKFKGGSPEKERSFLDLNGEWKFHYSENYESADKEFYLLERDCNNWSNIKVPGHIQLQGYDLPQYPNIQYPWDGRENIIPGSAPTVFNPVAHYVKYVDLSASIVNSRSPIIISFQGVEAAFALWVNGEFAGYSEDSFTPSEFNITDMICEGNNKIAVMVFKWSSGSWLEDQDFWCFSGIFRDVFIYTWADFHIWDLSTPVHLNQELSQATINISAELVGKIGDEAKIEISIQDNEDNIVASLTDIIEIETSKQKNQYGLKYPSAGISLFKSEIIINEHKLVAITNSSFTEYKWNAFEKLEENDRYLFLFVHMVDLNI